MRYRDSCHRQTGNEVAPHGSRQIGQRRVLGRLVERLYGRWQFAWLYLASATGANLLSLAVNGGTAVCAGASGGVFSLYGALLVFLWRERGQVDPAEFRWLLMAAGGFTAVSLAMGVFVTGIDNAAHVGGLVCGALLAPVLAKPWSAQSPAPGFIMRWAPARLARADEQGVQASGLLPSAFVRHGRLPT